MSCTSLNLYHKALSEVEKQTLLISARSSMLSSDDVTQSLKKESTQEITKLVKIRKIVSKIMKKASKIITSEMQIMKRRETIKMESDHEYAIDGCIKAMIVARGMIEDIIWEEDEEQTEELKIALDLISTATLLTKLATIEKKFLKEEERKEKEKQIEQEKAQQPNQLKQPNQQKQSEQKEAQTKEKLQQDGMENLREWMKSLDL